MRFHFQAEGENREVVVRAKRYGKDWIAAAVLLPKEPGDKESFLRTGSTQTAVQFRSPTKKKAIARIAFLLENAYGCSRIE